MEKGLAKNLEQQQPVVFYKYKSHRQCRLNLRGWCMVNHSTLLLLFLCSILCPHSYLVLVTSNCHSVGPLCSLGFHGTNAIWWCHHKVQSTCSHCHNQTRFLTLAAAWVLPGYPRWPGHQSAPYSDAEHQSSSSSDPQRGRVWWWETHGVPGALQGKQTV